MIIFKILGVFLILFGLYDIYESRIIHGRKFKVYEAEIIDEVEDELYDNTGGIKTRFFKVYCFEEDGENVVVRSERPLRRTTDTVGNKLKICVDTKNRKAVERSDMLFYFICGLLLTVLGIIILYISFNLGGIALWMKM